MTCSIASVMGAIGDRWGMLLLRDLMLGLRRYDDLRQSTGITNATLSDRLKALEQNGLIERHPYQERPTRYEYRLTAQGRDMALVLLALAQVGDKWNLDGLEGPPLHFLDGQTGQGVKLALVNEVTGQPVAWKEVTVQPGPGADELVHWRLEKRQPRGADQAD